MSKLNLNQANEVLELYAKPYDSSIDSGNLFLAACEYKSAYQQSLEIIKGLMAGLETYHLESCDRYDNYNICESCKALTEAKEKLKTMGVENG